MELESCFERAGTRHLISLGLSNCLGFKCTEPNMHTMQTRGFITENSLRFIVAKPFFNQLFPLLHVLLTRQLEINLFPENHFDKPC